MQSRYSEQMLYPARTIVTQLTCFDNRAIQNIQPLTEGKNNQNFKVSTDQGDYLLKICHTSEVQGIIRQTEYDILEKVHRADLAPKAIAFDATMNAIITEFLDLPTWSLPEIQTISALKSFGKSIRQIHALAPIPHKYYITDLLDRYWQFLKDTPEVQEFNQFFAIVREKLDFYHQSSDIRFCHNDLCYGHFLKSETGNKIIFLDWEMAGMNDIYSDLAAFIHFQRLDSKQMKQFLQFYSEFPLNLDKLSVHQDAILLRELLWVLSKLKAGNTDSFYPDYWQRCLNTVCNKQKKYSEIYLA